MTIGLDVKPRPAKAPAHTQGAIAAETLVTFGMRTRVLFFGTLGHAAAIRRQANVWLRENGHTYLRAQAYRTHPNVGQTYTTTEWEIRLVRRVGGAS